MPANHFNSEALAMYGNGNTQIEAVISSTAPAVNTTAESSITSRSEVKDTNMENAANSDLDAIELDWDGPDDPENPMNWPNSKRYALIVTVAAYTLLVNLTATMFSPGASQLITEFDVHSSVVLSLTVSIYVLGFAVGSLVLAPLSELYGRLLVYAVSGVVFVAFIVGCAFATNVSSFIIFRFLSGCAGSAPMAIAGGSLADVAPLQERSRWMSWFAAGPMLGPVVGPIAGGFISQSFGWRWDFRAILIMSGIIAALCVCSLRETYAPVILRNRTRRRGKEPGVEQQTNVSGKDSTSSTTSVHLLHEMTRPLRLLLFSPIVLSLSAYAGFSFGLMFLLFTTFKSVYAAQYGFSTGMTGLTYLGLGAGMFLGLFAQGFLSQKVADRLANKRDTRRPEDRLALMAYVAPLLPVGLFWYGWSVQAKVHWIVPILGNVPIGFGFICIFMPQMIYLVEIFGSRAGASAMAANTVFRSLAGALLPLAGPSMYEKLGYGWGNSLLGFLAIAFIPIPWILFLYGHKIRLSRPVDV